MPAIPALVLTSAYDELNDYLVRHKLNTNVVRGIVDRAVAEATGGWAVTGVLVSSVGDITYGAAPVTIQYSAQVVGTGEYSQAVTWGVTGNISPLTVISASGLLTVDIGEFEDENEDPIIDHTLEIIAISADNPGVRGSAFFNCATEVYSVTYEANGGTGTTVDALSPYATGTEVTVEANNFTPPANAIFSNWAYYADGSGVAVPATFEIEANTILYAIWTPTWTVTYNANGGTGTMTDASSPYEDTATVAVAANGFTPPTNKLFLKWNTEIDGSGVDYDPAEEFAIQGNIVFYAIWKDTISQVLVKNAADGSSNGTTAAAAADIQFYATVTGAGTFSRDVIWSISGNNVDTFISNNGLVTLGASEFTAPEVTGHEISVTATSVADPLQSDTEVITCTVA